MRRAAARIATHPGVPLSTFAAELRSPDGRLDALQRAFHLHGQAQCGICTPGMLIAGEAFLASGAAPTDGEPAAPTPPPRIPLVSSALPSVPVLALPMVPALQFDAWQWLSLTLAAPVVTWGAWPFHRTAWANLRHGTATMDTLISVGTLAAFGWSLYALFLGDAGDPTMRHGFSFAPERGMGASQVYLEVAAGVTVFILAGRYFEKRSKRQAGAALRALLEPEGPDLSLVVDVFGKDKTLVLTYSGGGRERELRLTSENAGETLKALDRARVEHTGSYASKADSRRILMLGVKGVRVAYLAYTTDTNGIPLPNPWSLNVAENPDRVIADARRAGEQGADVALNSRNAEALDKIAAEIGQLGRRALVLPADHYLRDEAGFEEAMREAISSCTASGLPAVASYRSAHKCCPETASTSCVVTRMASPARRSARVDRGSVVDDRFRGSGPARRPGGRPAPRGSERVLRAPAPASRSGR